MKKIYLFSFMLLNYSTIFAQKVDLDRFWFEVNFQKLPKEPVTFNNRTFGVKVRLGGPIRNYVQEAAVYDQININGWKKVEVNPTVALDVSLDDFLFRGVQNKSEVQETKDNTGKVTSRTTYYWIEAIHEGRGLCRFSGPLTPRALTERELKEQEEAKQKEEKLAKNPFLANVTLNKAVANVSNEHEISLNKAYVYASSKERSTTDISNDFNNRRQAIYDEDLRLFADNSIALINDRMNSLYGFTPVHSRDFLWILNAKEHPEYESQQSAIQAVKLLMASLKPNELIDENAFKPLIDYLETVKTKYTGDDKRNKKMRYSAFYNLAKIYYYLDQPEKSIKESEGLVANGFDESDGEKLIVLSKELKSNLENAHLTSRHNLPLN